MNQPKIQTFIFTLIALFAFAANSVLCRLALNVEQVTPASFTAIRLISASLILFLLVKVTHQQPSLALKTYGNWRAAFFLFIYALCFSYAYISLDTATGALVLFACVQFTMLLVGWRKGQTLSTLEKVGITLALVGFVYFVYPELGTPSLLGCILMAVAGIAWGCYSLVGAKSTTPLYDTCGNFLKTIPAAIVILISSISMEFSTLTPAGLIYTILSGAIASGLGYALWYYVLPKLAPSIAAVSQSSVPIWAALGGVIFVAEPINFHLLISSFVILGGILLVLLSRSNQH